MRLRCRGYSLVEILMVLFVIALITISFFTLKQRDMEVDKAEDLGYRLFEYGQALGDFLRTEGKDYAASGPGIINYDGYQWLQEKGYLNKEFSLVVEPLYVENIPGKSTSLQTVIIVKDIPGRPGEYELMLDLVEVGPVYSRNDVRTDENGNKVAFQDASLIARAVNYANEYRDNLKGSGVIQYRRIELGKESPPGSEPPASQPFEGLSIIQGTMVDQNMWNDAWLLRSGQNTMQGQIAFETAVPEDSAINRVNRINFRTDGLSAITDLQTINFAHGGLISNVQRISFVTTPGTVSAINDLDTITFKNGRSFHGLGYIGQTKYMGNDNATFRRIQLTINNYSVPIHNHHCYVSGFHRQANDAEQKDFQCNVDRDPTTNTFYLDIQAAKTSWCTIACYNFAP